MGNPRITFLSPPFTGKTVELTRSRYKVGRLRDADIIINHSTVSGIHCELVRNPDGSYQVLDAGLSTNGTRIGGRLVSAHPLIDSDLLQVGGVECMYDSNSDEPSTVTSFNTHIRVATNPIIPNQDISISPAWADGEDNSLVTMGLKALILVLGVAAFGLGLALAFRLT